MRCYRYLSRKYGLRSLKEGRLKLSFLTEFNDLLDTVGLFVGSFTDAFLKEVLFKQPDFEDFKMQYEHAGRMAKKYGPRCGGLFTKRSVRECLKDQFNRGLASRVDERESLLLLCTSKVASKRTVKARLDESLLWAHYAECGRGLRIGIDFPDDIPDHRLVQVRYASKIPTFNLRRYKPDSTDEDLGQLYLEFLKERISHKSSSWRYEHEVRYVTSVAARWLEREHGMCFWRIPKKWVYRVDFGPKFFKDDFAFLRAVERLKAQGYEKTHFTVAKVDPKHYSFYYEPYGYLLQGKINGESMGDRHLIVRPSPEPPPDGEEWRFPR